MRLMQERLNSGFIHKAGNENTPRIILILLSQIAG